MELLKKSKHLGCLDGDLGFVGSGIWLMIILFLISILGWYKLRTVSEVDMGRTHKDA